MSRVPIAICILVAAAGAVSATTGATSAEILVVGTGDAAFDVPAVQAAVDGGGEVRLLGRFSFDAPPVDGRTVLATGAVSIVGVPDADGQMPVITGGTVPFRADAPGLPVSFRNLRLVGATGSAIEIRAADGAWIEGCEVAGVQPQFADLVGAPVANGFLVGFFVPGAVVGDIVIANNELDIGGTSSDRTEAIAVLGAGRADSPADVWIQHNDVRNTTARGIDVRQIVGQVAIERNSITTGAVGGQDVVLADRFVDGIRVIGRGSYRIAHNLVDAGFANAAGIRLQGSPAAAIVDAVVESNDITMTAAAGAVFGSESAGIEVRRGAVGNVVQHNRIRGRARAALALIAEAGRAPQDNLFLGNNISTFGASHADVFIGPGVVNTTILGGYGSVDDQGIGTVIKGLR